MSVSSVSFNERLSRIAHEKTRLGGKIVLHVGETEMMVRSLGDIRQQQKDAPERLSVFMVVLAFILGGLAFALATAGRMRLVSEVSAAEVTGATALAIGLAMAMGLGVALGVIAGIRGRAVWTGLVLGLVLCAASLHNLAHYAPDLAAQAFTPDWASIMRAQTAPATLELAGHRIGG